MNWNGNRCHPCYYHVLHNTFGFGTRLGRSKSPSRVGEVRSRGRTHRPRSSSRINSMKTTMTAAVASLLNLSEHGSN
jgi:hypothetical protein